MQGKAPPANRSNFPNFCLCPSGPALQWKPRGEGSASHHRFLHADASLQTPGFRHINTEAGSHRATLSTPRRGGSLTADRFSPSVERDTAKHGRDAPARPHPLLPASTLLSTPLLPAPGHSRALRGMLLPLSDAVDSPLAARGGGEGSAACSAHIQPGCGCPEEKLPGLASPRQRGSLLLGGSPVVWGLLEPRQSGRDAVAGRAEPSLSIPGWSLSIPGWSPGRRARRWMLRPAAPPHEGHACGDKASPTRVQLTPPGPQSCALNPSKRKNPAR